MGAAVGTASTIGLSGCLGSLTGGGDASQVDQWLVDPRHLPGGPDQYTIVSFSPSTFDEYADEFSRDDWNEIRGMTDDYGFTRLYVDELDRITVGSDSYRSNGFDVIVGDIDAEEIDDDFRREGLRSRGDYEGFELYEHDDAGWAGGVVDGTMILAGDTIDGDPVQVVEDIIDTSNGERRAYDEVDPEFETLIEEVSIGDFFVGIVDEPADETEPEWGIFRNHVGTGLTISLGEGDSTLEFTLTFLDERDVRERDLDDWTRESDMFRLWRDLEIETDEEIARIEGTVPTRDIFEASWV